MAWSDADIRRFSARVRILMRRGLREDEAEVLAERLVERDRGLDDRRICLECANLRPGFKCEAGGPVLMQILQRCPTFNWEKP